MIGNQAWAISLGNHGEVLDHTGFHCGFGPKVEVTESKSVKISLAI